MNLYKIGIIGGKGKMGKWFETFFSSLGFNVLVSDIDTQITNYDIAKQCDVIILSTPIKIALEIAKQIGPMLTDKQLFMDFCSLKEDIVNQMLEYSRAEVVGTHPMFGPFIQSIKGQNVIMCSVRVSRWEGWFDNILKKEGAFVGYMDTIAHDKHMAVVQSLTHFLNICMARTLQKMGINIEDSFHYSTPIFRLNCALIGRLFAQDIDLYTTLVGENKYFNEVFELFLSSMTEGKESIILDPKSKGVQFMQEIQTFLGDFCEYGLKESNKFLDVIFKS